MSDLISDGSTNSQEGKDLNVETKKETKESETKDESKDESKDELKEGDRVYLYNIPSGFKKLKNGLKGTVSMVKPKNKFDVKLDTGDIGKSINLKNLKRLSKTKDDSSNNYYIDPEVANSNVPQKITKPKKKLPKVQGPSSWNSGMTTWEDKQLNDWSFKKIRSLLSMLEVEIDSSTIILDVSDVTGDRCSIVYTRGKIKYGFELQIKGTIKGEFSGQDIDAKFEIPDIDESSFKDNDYDFKIKGAPSGIRKQLRKKLRPVVHKKINTFVEELLKQ